MISDSSFKLKYFLEPGYVFASKEPYLVSTVLGSCVSVCIWDEEIQVGGMNHYIHADFKNNERNCKYGNVAIPYLIKSLVDMGAKKNNLKAHIVGGAGNEALNSFKISLENVNIAEQLLKKYSIQIVSMDVGEKMGRKVVFDNKTGEIIVCKVQKLRRNDWYEDN